MDFFERQDKSRRNPKRLVAYFVAGVALLILTNLQTESWKRQWFCNPKGIVSSSPGLRGASYPGLEDTIPLGLQNHWRFQLSV